MLQVPDVQTTWQTRAATLDDLQTAVDLFNICSQEEDGTNLTTLEEQRREWASPEMSLAENTRAVFDLDGQMLAYTEVWQRAPYVRAFVWGRVHPAYRGSGLGTQLLHWSERRARQNMAHAPEGARVVLQVGCAADDTRTQALMHNEGYAVARRFYTMKIEFDGPPPEPADLPGIVVRPLDLEHDDLRAVYEADDEAFSDHWGHVPAASAEDGFVHWRRNMTEMREFDPVYWFLAMDGDKIAGSALCRLHWNQEPHIGWVDHLSVRRPWRRRGVAQALLYAAFGAFYRAGQQGAALGVDATNPTGATRLYEKAGMFVYREREIHQKELRPGEDLIHQG